MDQLRLDNGFWYLATPYSKYALGINAAFEDACKAAAKLLSAGVHVFSPIAHTHPIASYGGLDYYSHELFVPLDEKMMRAAHGLLVLRMDGWEESLGIKYEVEFFTKNYRPVVHLAWPSLELL